MRLHVKTVYGRACVYNLELAPVLGGSVMAGRGAGGIMRLCYEDSAEGQRCPWFVLFRYYHLTQYWLELYMCHMIMLSLDAHKRLRVTTPSPHMGVTTKIVVRL